MMDPIISTQNITYYYGDHTNALKGVTLSLAKGRKIAVLGNNGAGKSTLFMHLNGILKPTSGTVYFKGKPVEYSKKSLQQLRKSIGLVFQNPDEQLFSPTVYDDVAYGPKNLGLSQETVAEAVHWALEQTGTLAMREKAIHSLSLGEKKRVAIAGVLAMNPEIIILDEPTAGLDAAYSRKLIQLLDELHQSGKTLVLSTHDINLAYEWAEELVIMCDGKVIAVGSPKQVLERQEILQACKLEKPLLMEIYEHLVKHGYVPSQEELPRRKEELLELLTPCQPAKDRVLR
ncbi:energy-coupling factor ABC transporter ATP-binding protein [Brevibacillus ginsengisoli]|uniref:energy-coupling factor ABC transporter ATP-binding protein n=1 Tax=Brevibacillus ginsengisoli TaxID=363854 RepID=UPI003CECFD20